jgi:hypothetical protein
VPPDERGEGFFGIIGNVCFQQLPVSHFGHLFNHYRSVKQGDKNLKNFNCVNNCRPGRKRKRIKVFSENKQKIDLDAGLRVTAGGYLLSCLPSIHEC